MESLFLIDMLLEYDGMELNDFLNIWLEEATFILKAQETQDIRQIWKVTGERHVIIIVNANGEKLDNLLMTMPIMKKMGNHVTTTITSLRSYESFANDINKIISKDDRYVYTRPVAKEVGLYYWLRFDVEYKGMEMTDLLTNWSAEAKKALAAKSKGIVQDIWKCNGMRRVYALMCVDSPEMMDNISFDLPIMKSMGNQCHIDVKSVRKYEGFKEDLEKLCSSKE